MSHVTIGMLRKDKKLLECGYLQFNRALIRFRTLCTNAEDGGEIGFVISAQKAFTPPSLGVLAAEALVGASDAARIIAARIVFLISISPSLWTICRIKTGQKRDAHALSRSGIWPARRKGIRSSCTLNCNTDRLLDLERYSGRYEGGSRCWGGNQGRGQNRSHQDRLFHHLPRN